MSDDLVIDLYDEDLDPDEVERLTLSLRRELLELDEVERVAQAQAGPAPPGSRAVGLVEIGSLLVAIRPTVEAVGRVVGVLRDWFRRRSAASSGPHSTMRITVNGQTLELTPTQEQQSTLVAAFLAAAAEGGSASGVSAGSPAGSSAGSAAAPGERAGGP